MPYLSHGQRNGQKKGRCRIRWRPFFRCVPKDGKKQKKAEKKIKICKSSLLIRQEKVYNEQDIYFER